MDKEIEFESRDHSNSVEKPDTSSSTSTSSELADLKSEVTSNSTSQSSKK